jgi:GNAT superfamily N-acetyltransferase
MSRPSPIRLRPGLADDIGFLVEIIDMSSHGGIGEHYAAVYGHDEPWQVFARKDIARPGTELGYDMAVIAEAGAARAGAAFFNPLKAAMQARPTETERSAAIQRLILSLPATLLIREIAVLPRYRGQGIARKLIEAARAYAKVKRLGAVSLTVNADNAPAMALYESSGFVEVCDETIDGQRILAMRMAL